MKLSYFFAVIAFAASAISVQAQVTNSTPINTVPEGIATLNIGGTPAGSTSISYFSAPLVNDPVYTGAVSGISAVTVNSPHITTTNTIAVGDSPAPFTGTNFTTAAAPYFVKMLSGAETGRVMQILAFTSSTLTLDTTDGTGANPVALDLTNYAVAAGDTFEVFAGDTLGLMFGATTATLVPGLIGGTRPTSADDVNVYDRTQNQFTTYFFNTTDNHWEQKGNSASANNVIIFPYSAFFIVRQGGINGAAASSLVLTGRVAEVNHAIRTPGNNTAVSDSTGYPVPTTFAALNLVPPNWTVTTTTNPKVNQADTVVVWDPVHLQFNTYYELQNPTTQALSWRLVGDTTNADQSNTQIPADTTITYLKRTASAVPFVAPPLPYSLTQ